MEEIWVDIKSYEGLYQVSNLGRVRSLERMVRNGGDTVRVVKEKILKPWSDKNGYLHVTLCDKSTNKKKFKIHRLVATMFIPNPNNLPQVNHKDEDKQNNKFDNLEWCTNRYNQEYGTKWERQKENSHKKEVVQLSKDNEIIKIWESIREANRNGYNRTCIYECCVGTQKIHRGYKWMYYEDYIKLNEEKGE